MITADLVQIEGRRYPARRKDAEQNPFERQWELFLSRAVKDEPAECTLLEGAKGVQLVEKGMESWQERRWVDVPPLEE